jgi:hypothetical protein
MGKKKLNKEIKLNTVFFIIIINVGIRVSLHAPRLIHRALKLMIM